VAEIPASICLVDGVLLADPRVSAFDRGFLHGEAVFETIRVYDRLPWRLEEHLARMRGAATRVGIAMAPTARWIAETTEALRSKPWDGDAVLRLTLSRGAPAGGVGDAATAVPVRVVTLAPLSPAIARAADVAEERPRGGGCHTALKGGIELGAPASHAVAVASVASAIVAGCGSVEVREHLLILEGLAVR
jgi:branched-subunit amino acid aminotransferase/4-amino-4-deoxychorismate lyase